MNIEQLKFDTGQTLFRLHLRDTEFFIFQNGTQVFFFKLVAKSRFMITNFVQVS